MADEMSEFAAVFIGEAGGRLEELRGAVTALKGNPAQGPDSEKARISSHTIRGMSAQMGYEDIAKVAKEVELLFVELKKKNAAPTPEMMAGVDDCARALGTMFEALGGGKASGVDAGALAARMQAMTSSIA